MHDLGLDDTSLPRDDQQKSWLKRAKGKKGRAASDSVPQPGSLGMIQSVAVRVQDLRKWFTDRPDELVVLPENSSFTSSRDKG